MKQLKTYQYKVCRRRPICISVTKIFRIWSKLLNRVPDPHPRYKNDKIYALLLLIEHGDNCTNNESEDRKWKENF